VGRIEREEGLDSTGQRRSGASGGIHGGSGGPDQPLMQETESDRVRPGAGGTYRQRHGPLPAVAQVASWWCGVHAGGAAAAIAHDQEGTGSGRFLCRGVGFN
jgi:hypothetical protein